MYVYIYILFFLFFLLNKPFPVVQDLPMAYMRIYYDSNSNIIEYKQLFNE